MGGSETSRWPRPILRIRESTGSNLLILWSITRRLSNNANVTVTLDQLFEVLGNDNVGVAEAEPVAPALTEGNISIGLVSVAANQVVLVDDNITQIEDAGYTPSSLILGDTTHLFRLNRTRGCFEYSYNGGVNWTSLSGVGGQQSKNIDFAMSPYTALSSDPPLEVSTAGGNVVINLPSIAGSPFPVEVTKSTGDANTVNGHAKRS